MQRLDEMQRRAELDHTVARAELGAATERLRAAERTEAEAVARAAQAARLQADLRLHTELDRALGDLRTELNQEMRPDLAPEQYTIALGASMLRIALDFDELVGTGLSFSSALAEMKRTQSAYDARVFAALEHLVRDAAQVDAADPSPALPLGDSLYQPVSGQASP